MDTSYLKLNSDGLFDVLSDTIEFVNSTPLDSFKVTMDYIGRPDKISLAFYGTDEYWWAILRANNLGYGFRSSLTFRRTVSQILDENMLSAISYNRILIIPSISDINIHLNKIKGY